MYYIEMTNLIEKHEISNTRNIKLNVIYFRFRYSNMFEYFDHKIWWLWILF